MRHLGHLDGHFGASTAAPALLAALCIFGFGCNSPEKRKDAPSAPAQPSTDIQPAASLATNPAVAPSVPPLAPQANAPHASAHPGSSATPPPPGAGTALAIPSSVPPFPSSFVLPTALPTTFPSVPLPPGIPTKLPAGFPTAIPSVWASAIPSAWPPPPAQH